MEQPNTAQSATRDGVSSDSAASANWVRELEQRIAVLEADRADKRLAVLEADHVGKDDLARDVASIKEDWEKILPPPGKNFVTSDDLEKRLSESHPTTSPTAVAARLCPECGSPAHRNCKLPPV